MPSNGGNSTFDTLTAIGGGYGGSYNAPVDETYGKGSNGGSGGGAAQFGGMSWVTAGSGTLNQGNSGAPEIVTEYYYTYGGGGGGGAGEVGHNPIDLYGSYENGGAGGNGLEYSISGTPTYYAGGGAGSSHGSGSGVSLGGSGGGGNGQYNGTAGTDGTDGLGGGGGGGGENTTGGNGGDGVVIIRYLTNTVPPDTTPPTGTMTLGSGDTYWITNTSPTINLTTDDADQYQLCLNSAIAGSECTSVAQAWASYIATPTPYDFTSQGTKTLYVQFKDTTGNISETYSDSITIDYTSPVITVSSPTNNTTYTTTSINFDVSATDETSLGSIIPDLDSSLVSWWRMDDIDGSILTDYMGNNDGTISGVSQTTGKFGKGMSFNGSGFINNGNPVNLQLQSFTALAWIKPNAQDYGFIFSYAPTGSSGWGMVYGNLWVPGESGNHYLHFDDAWVSDVLRYDIDLHDGNYHQVGIYRDTENNVGLIIDGQIVNSGTYSGIFGFDDFYIGSRDGNDNFSGSIDDVMVFNRAISADELIALYNGTAINYNSTLTEGTYTYKAYAQDTAGNVASSTLSTFNIDFTSPTGGSITYTNGYNTSPTITYTLGTDDISGINNSSGKIQRAGATLSNNVCSSFSSFSDLVTEYDGSYIDTTVVGGNCYKYQYLISDNIGNTATYTSANIVKIDVTLPTTSDNYTNNNIWQITSQTITLTPTDLGGSGLAWTKYCISTTDDCVVSSGTDYISPVNTFPEGINYFRYASVDNAGNTQATVSKIVKLDTSNPLVDIGINKTRTSTYTQTSTTSDVISGVASYLWSSDINVTFGATTSESTTIFASTDGDHIIRLTVTDVAGNSAYDEYTLTWDTTPPVVSNISPAEGTTISRNNQVIDFTISENGGCRLSTTNKSYDDMSADVSCTSNSLLISCTLPNFTSSGEKDIYIACNDSYNNADTASTTSHISYRVRSSNVAPITTDPIITTIIDEPVITIISTTTATTTPENIFNIQTASSTNSRIVTINITPNTDTRLIIISSNSDFSEAISIPLQIIYEYDLCQSSTNCPSGDYTIYAKSLDIFNVASPVVSTPVVLIEIPIIEEIIEVIVPPIIPDPEVIIPPTIVPEETNTPDIVIGDTTNNNDVTSTTGNDGTDTQEGISVEKLIDDGIEIIKGITEEAKIILAIPAVSVTTKTITTVGVVAGTTATISTLAFATPITFSEVWFLPGRLFGLILGWLGVRRKSRPWGTVYDSVTKRPIDPAYVSLINQVDGKEVAMAITDIDGRYGFSAPKGKYTIIARKTNYIFPSVKINNLNFDEVYSNLYFGNEIIIGNDGDIITKDIPMDSQDFDWNEFAKNKQGLNVFIKSKDIFWAKFSKIVFWLGFAVALLALLLAPAPYNYGIFALYIVLYVLNFFGFGSKKSGILKDTRTNSPLSFAIVKIFREGSDMEMIKKVADINGKYYCLIPNGSYYMRVEKKNVDGTYTSIYQSNLFDVERGIINMNVEI
jgi:hypothetical protein